MSKYDAQTLQWAIAANGGGKHRQDWCKCDPDVGAAPCEYCAIWDALSMCDELIVERDELRQVIENAIEDMRSGHKVMEYLTKAIGKAE